GLANYTITFADGTLSVTPAPLTITAEDREKVFGEELELGTTAFADSGLRNDDRVDSVFLFSAGTPADAPVAASPYAIEVSDPVGSGLGNYVITLLPGQLVVLPDDSLPPEPDPSTQPPALVTPVFDLPNPPDTITVFDVSDGPSDPGPVTPVDSAPGETATATTEAAEAQQVQGAMDSAATGVQQAMQACRQETPLGSELLDCIANALGSYASALDDLALDLPPELAQVSAIIRQAQTGVRDIRTRTDARLATAATDAERRAIERDAVEEAVGVVRGAADEVRRAIELIRADDPQLVSVFSAQGASVVRAIESVEIELVRAIGI
ncbi:MBG-2 domain-containing protein, partial [Rhodobacteraceae bacterium 2376]